MRLVSVGFDGYKRFAKSTQMNVDGSVIAVVGPNEAGKTSLLKALSHLRSKKAFDKGELTRGQEPPEEGRVVWARFLLDDEDREAIGPLPGIDKTKWYVLYKDAEGTLFHITEPNDVLARDLKPRRKAHDSLLRAANHSLLNSDGGTTHAFAALATSLAPALGGNDASLESDAVEQIRSGARALESIVLPSGVPKYISELPAQLNALADHEGAAHPLTHVLSILDKRRPSFMVFGQEDRNLRSHYDLGEVAESPPVALANLARLANLDLVALRDAQANEDLARSEKLVEDANRALRKRFEDAWRQSGVYLRLRSENTALHVLVSSVDGYTSVAERSDGLLAFIALLTFTALHGKGKPLVLLIDEAENHLHYDAQADLVRVFSKQQQATKVIYTTHSAGCLPNDLAMVRLVAAHDDGTSSITNSYWADGPGLSPLLVGMGASVLALTPARRAVFAEGGADALLLPALLRAATGHEELDFQVVPGLSEVKPADVSDLDLDAASVAYHVDGDEAGKEIRRKLIKGGVPEERIVVLGGKASRLTVEDLVDRELYASAVSAVVQRAVPGTPALAPSKLPARNRPGAVREWCKDLGIDEPNKVAVAYEVLDLHGQREGPLLDQSRGQVALDTFDALAALLRLDPPGR